MTIETRPEVQVSDQAHFEVVVTLYEGSKKTAKEWEAIVYSALERECPPAHIMIVKVTLL